MLDIVQKNSLATGNHYSIPNEIYKLYDTIPVEDYRSIREIYIQAFNAPPRNEKWTNQTADAFLYRELDNGATFYIIKVEDACAGFRIVSPAKHTHCKNELWSFGANDKTAYLSAMAIHNNFRGQGLGSELFRYALEDIRQDAKYETVMVRCRKDSFTINNIVRKNGFKKIGERNSNIGCVSSNKNIYRLQFTHLRD